MLTVVAGDVLADRIGTGAPRVLALHGWGRSGADFARILHGMDALAVHLHGFGQTPPPPTAWGSADYAAHLAAALDQAGTGADDVAPTDRVLPSDHGGHPAVGGRYVVVGHSFGGRVAVRLAAQRPDLVSALVLTGVPLVRATPPPRPALSLRVAKRLRAANLLPDSVVERLRRRGGSADYNAAQGVMRDVLVRVVTEDYRDDLGRVTAPVHLVWGELDDSAPLAGARLAADLFPDAHLAVVRGAGHLLDGDLEQAVRTTLTAVLDGERR